MPSVLDRLIDPDSGGTAWRRGYGVQQIVDVVRRDLEDLLNTRQSHQRLPREYTEVHNSIVAFGLPDLAALEAHTPQQREEIGSVIERIIARFEPRLRNVRARMIDAGEKDRRVRFHIDARLNVDPAPEVSFETVVELITGHASIKASEA
ncbi:MAG: type VI secretion system baseplate subunit TssE [Planctomycetes bacterium]|nr:type VI secretion system baseplate subunit TssE [Planctomycetota bacterium]